jgi:hypothetical protein
MSRLAVNRNYYLVMVYLMTHFGSKQIAPNFRIISEIIHWEGCEGERPWPNLRHYAGICLRGMRITSVRTAELKTDA